MILLWLTSYFYKLIRLYFCMTKTLAVKDSTYEELLKLKREIKVKSFDELIKKIIEENKKLKKLILVEKLNKIIGEELEVDYKEFRSNFLNRY